MLFIILCTLCVISAVSESPPCQRRVCYFTNWTQYRPGMGKFMPEDIDPFMCTHLIYAFATLTNGHLAPFEWNDEDTSGSTGMYTKFNNLKQANPQLKTMLALGGYKLGSAPFTQMVSTASTRADFIKDAINFLRSHNFDGLDLDWEYPAHRGSPDTDRHKFTLLVQELSDAFDREAASTGNERLILSAAVAAGKDKIDKAYEIADISSKLDMINVMTYDFHGHWDPITGHNSPLYGHAGETGLNANYNIDFTLNYYVSKGAPREKINMGMANYGQSFTLDNPAQSGVGAAASKAGPAGQYTRQAGIKSYYEICELLKSGAQVTRIADQEVPYLVKGSEWIGYDDPESLRNKVRYVRDNGYGGVMFWSLDLDDFHGTACGQGPYPLINAVKDECGTPRTSSGNTTAPGTVTPIPATTAVAPGTNATGIPGSTTSAPGQATTQPPTQPTQAPAQVTSSAPNQNQGTSSPTSAPGTTASPNITGTSNPTSAPGSTASPNITGTSSPTSAPGSTGNPNITGTPSPTSAPGSTGNPIITGIPTSAPGATGIPIITGTSSPTSTPGSTGSPIITGTSSPTSVPGSSSPMINGTHSPTSAPGSTGSPNITGTSSLTSAPGSTASPIITGTSSPTSAPGSTGNPNITGTSSPTSAPGTTGNPNITGTSSPTSAPGSTPSPIITSTSSPTSAPGTTASPIITGTSSPTSAPGSTGNPIITGTPMPTHHMDHTNKIQCDPAVDDFYPSSEHCSHYFICTAGLAYEVTCAQGLVFNAVTKFCDWPQNYNCQINTTQGSQTSVVTSNPATTTSFPASTTTTPQTTTTATTNTPNPTTQPPATTASFDIKDICRDLKLTDGIHEDPTSCSHFIECANHNTFRLMCGPGTVFNKHILSCDLPGNTPDC